MPVNPQVLQELIKKYGKKAVGAAVNAAKAKVMVPNMTGTATAAGTALRDIPKVESTVGKEAAVAAAALASPAVVADSEILGPALFNFGKDLASFEAIDNTPRIWGGDRVSGTVADYAGRGVRAVLPDAIEEGPARAAEMITPFLVMAPEAIAGRAIERGIRSGARAVSAEVEKKLADLAAKKDWKAFKQYAKDNGLGIATDVDTGETLLQTWQGPMYLKDGKLEPVEGLDVAGSAALKPQGSLESTGFSSEEWNNWLVSHGQYFPKAAGYPSSPATAFKYVPDYEADIIGDQAEVAGLSAQEYWTIMAEANAKHKAYPKLKYQHLKKENFPNLSENQFNSIIDESVSKDITPEQTYLNLSYENGKLASVPPKPSVGWHKTYTEIDPTDYSYLSNSGIQTLLDEYAKLGYTPQEAEKYLIAENKQAHVNLLKKKAKTSSGSPIFEEHGPWESEYPPLYPDSASDMPVNIGHVWDKPYIRVSQPKRQSLDEIKTAAKEGRIAPLQTTVTDVFGMPAQVSEDWAANLLTNEGKRQAPNGLLYAWKGNPGHALFPGKAGKYGDPYWSDVYMGNYESIFSAEHDLAKTYTGPGYSEASHIDYSTAGGAPNLMLLAYPKQPIYDTGIDLAGMHWNKLFDPTPKNIALYRKLLAEADAKGIKPYQVTGPIADDYYKMLSTNPFSLKGWGNFRSVDDISSFLDRHAPDFGYNGVLMRNLEDNASGTGGHGEFIWTPKHGGYPKAVHPANTLDLDWSVDNYLRKKGGPIHIKPENRGKFTALMKRTGKPASWFKAHGTPAQKKMATFALNARHWKHGDGGFLHEYPDKNVFRGGGDSGSKRLRDLIAAYGAAAIAAKAAELKSRSPLVNNAGVVSEVLTADKYSGKEYTFDEAYKDARKKGQKTFFWDGRYYNTDYEGEHGRQYKEDVSSGKAAAWERKYPEFTNPELRKEKQEELDTYGITNEQTQNKTFISKRALNNLAFYEDYDANQAIDALVLNHNQRAGEEDYSLENSTHYNQLRYYLGYPIEKNQEISDRKGFGAPVKISKYLPSNTNGGADYYYTFYRNPYGNKGIQNNAIINEYKRLKKIGDDYLSSDFYSDAEKYGLDYATSKADSNLAAWSNFFDKHADELREHDKISEGFIPMNYVGKFQTRDYGNISGLGNFANYGTPEYRSFYDLWDIGLGQGKSTLHFGLGKPFEYYDRRYHNKDEWKLVPDPDIDSLYNNLEYANGGRIKGKRNGKYFVTELGDRREKKFQDWYANAAATLGLDPNPDAYSHAYDYRGYWLNNRDADVSSPDFHFPDTWKQPHHPTFSTDSIYAKGHDGVGHWEGDTFVPGPFNNLMQATEPAVVAGESPVVQNNYVPSDDILKYIKDTEAFRDQWYQDGNGVWTIGYGFTGDDVRKRFPNGMTQAEADQYFADTVSRRVPMFINATPNFDKLNQNQRDALFSYYYNIGHGGYTRKSPAMQEALKNFDLDTVVNNIDFGYNDKKNRGLRKRRDYERNLFSTPMDYGGILNRLRNVCGDNDEIKAAILRAKNVKKN